MRVFTLACLGLRAYGDKGHQQGTGYYLSGHGKCWFTVEQTGIAWIQLVYFYPIKSTEVVLKRHR